MKINKILFLLLLGCIGGNVWAQNNALQQQFAKELVAKSCTVQTIVCDFTETRHMDVMAKDLDRIGQFHYKTPSQMRLDFTSGDWIIMTEEAFSMRTNGRTSTTRVTANPMLRQVRNVCGACMTGNIERLMGSGRVTITQNKNGYRVELVPSSRSALKYVNRIVLDFDRTDMTLEMLRMEQPSGDYMQYVFRNKKLNTTVKSSLFDIQ